MCIFASELYANKVGAIDNMVYTFPTYMFLLKVTKVTSKVHYMLLWGG